MESELLEASQPNQSSHRKALWNREPTVVDQLREALDGLMYLEEVTLLSNAAKPMVQFGGQLATGDHEEIFAEILRRFESLGYTPFLTVEDDLYILKAIPHVVNRKPIKFWLNLVLFVLTVLSVLLIGAIRELEDIPRNIPELLRGWPFAVALLGILSAHELSHYFVGRRHGSPVSLPYFVPMPFSILGTMGAVIVQRGPMRSRKALFDIGIAGPIGGLVVAIPLLFIGLAFTKVGSPAEFMEVLPGETIVVSQEGNSLLYLAAKYIVHGRILPDRSTGEDVWLSPPSRGGSVVFAAWAGLLVTALNLFPIGQFDGGHIAYAMWGSRAWKVARGFMYLIFAWGVLLSVLGNIAGTTWLVWGGLGLLMGPRHPPPLDDTAPLDSKRRWLGWVMVIVFLLILIPIPMITVEL